MIEFLSSPIFVPTARAYSAHSAPLQIKYILLLLGLVQTAGRGRRDMDYALRPFVVVAPGGFQRRIHSIHTSNELQIACRAGRHRHVCTMRRWTHLCDCWPLSIRQGHSIPEAPRPRHTASRAEGSSRTVACRNREREFGMNSPAQK